MSGGGSQSTLMGLAAAAAVGAVVVGTGGAAAIPLAIGAAAAAGGSAYAGGAAMEASKLQSKQLKVEQQQAELEAKRKAVAIKEELSSTLSAQKALMAASGTGGQGTADDLERTSRANAGLDLNLNAAGLSSLKQTYAYKQSQTKLEGQAGLIKGLGDAAGAGTSDYYTAKKMA